MPTVAILAPSGTVSHVWENSVAKLVPARQRQPKKESTLVRSGAQASVSEVTKIQDLPDSVLCRIFGELSRSDAASAAPTCQRWCAPNLRCLRERCLRLVLHSDKYLFSMFEFAHPSHHVPDLLMTAPIGDLTGFLELHECAQAHVE